jgi:hypothetical protein
MSVERLPQVNQSTRAALEDLQAMIRRRYPTACFAIAQGEDPEGFYLRATVDLADVDEVVDQGLLDRLFEFQVEQGLPVYVIPLQPIERVLEGNRTRLAAAKSVVAHTAGLLKGSQPFLSSQEEKIAAEEAIADEGDKRPTPSFVPPSPAARSAGI